MIGTKSRELVKMFKTGSCKMLTLAGALFAVSLASGCSMHEETKLTQNKVQVKQENFTEEIPTRLLDQGTLSGLVARYERHGDGPVQLSVTYDPGSRTNTAMKAGDEAGRIVRALKAEGLQADIRPEILPVRGQGEDSVTLVSYASYDALAPKDCEMLLAGYDPGTKVEADEAYKLGCTIDTLFARQVARPKDLMGQGQDNRTTEGRRAANIGDFYRSGQPNEPLKGQSASGDD
jgi:pilus assembly protein CpaD